VYRGFNAPQRPSQPPQRDHLLFFVLAQDIAHVDGAYARRVFNVLNQLVRWPLLGDSRGFRKLALFITIGAVVLYRIVFAFIRTGLIQEDNAARREQNWYQWWR
jgi:hypothetical protein